MSKVQVEAQSAEEARRAAKRRKRDLPVEIDKRNDDRRAAPGVDGLIDEVILAR